MVFTFSESNKPEIGPYLLLGLLCVLYGAGIYYILPYSLLTGNYSLVLGIFFFILIGMILGLVLLAFNFQRIFEIVTAKILFFWERKSMQRLMIKNLTAHRKKNQLTAIIYSLTLGTIIFIIVALNLQI